MGVREFNRMAKEIEASPEGKLESVISKDEEHEVLEIDKIQAKIDEIKKKFTDFYEYPIYYLDIKIKDFRTPGYEHLNEKDKIDKAMYTTFYKKGLSELNKSIKLLRRIRRLIVANFEDSKARLQ